MNFAVRAGGEDGVDVSADDECGTAAGAFSAADDVADGVLFDVRQTVLFEHAQKDFGSFFLMEGRGRSFSQNDLVGNALFLLLDGQLESCLNLSVRAQGFDDVLCFFCADGTRIGHIFPLRLFDKKTGCLGSPITLNCFRKLPS